MAEINLTALRINYLNGRWDYRDGVKQMLKERGPQDVHYEDEDYIMAFVSIIGIGKGYKLDKVRYNEEEDDIEFHCTEMDGEKEDRWISQYVVDDVVFGLFDHIDWKEEG